MQDRVLMNLWVTVKNGIMRATLFPFRVILMEGQSVPE
jgi:hypothetical protein